MLNLRASIRPGIVVMLSLYMLTAMPGCTASKAPGTITPTDAPTAAEVSRQREQDRRRAIKLVERGDDSMAEGELLEALEHYAQATQVDEDLAAAWNNLGVALMRTERYADADAALLLAQRADPADPRPAYNRGLLNFERGYIRQAREFFQTAIDVEPQYLPALWGAIKCDRDLAQSSKATLQLIRRALLLETDDEYLESLRLMRVEIEDQIDAQSAE